MKKKLIISLLLISGTVLGQDDSLTQYIEKNARAIDSLKLIVKDVVVSGNKITKDEVILREMSLKRGVRFTLKKYTEDISNIYNLGLFTRVDIIPVSVDREKMLLNVDVNERWYILPLPNAGLEDGEWKKLWASLNLKWQNFRGRNETVSLYGRIFYNPSVSFTYSVPWIGEKLHMFTSYSLGYSKYRNQSLLALGRGNTGDIIAYNDVNYSNINFHTNLTIG